GKNKQLLNKRRSAATEEDIENFRRLSITTEENYSTSTENLSSTTNYISNTMTDNTGAGNPMDYMKLIGKLPLYYGMKNADVASEWLTNIKMYIAFFPANYNQFLFITAVSSIFKDRATTWWYNNGKDIKTWDKFESEFTDKFIKTNEDEAWNKLRNIKQDDGVDMDHFIRNMDKLFVNAGEFKTYGEVTEEAVNLENILFKYSINNTNTTNTDKRVSFNLADNSNRSQDSIGGTKFNGVTEDKASQKFYANNSNSNNNRQPYNRPPFTERRLVCWNCNKEGHPSRMCPEAPQSQQLVKEDTDVQQPTNEPSKYTIGKDNMKSDKPRVVSIVQVSPATKDENRHYDKNIDVYAVKRKTAGSTDTNNSKNPTPNKKGKNIAEGSNNNRTSYPVNTMDQQYTYSQPAGQSFFQGQQSQQTNQGTSFALQPPQHNMFQPQEAVIQQTMPQATQPMQVDVPPVVKKFKKKRQTKKRDPDEIPIEKTWDKLRRTQITMSVAEYLAMNKKTSRDVKEGLLYIHRRKPSVRKIAQPRASVTNNNPVVINALRSGGLLDEQAYANSVNTFNTSLGNFSNSDSSEEDNGNSGSSTSYTSNSESSDSEYDDDIEDEEDDDSVQVSYPYSRAKMKSAQPVRVFISINDQLVEAVLDSGAAVSVCSIKLARRLGLEIDRDEKIQLTGFGNKNVYCNIAPNVEVRIGGRKRIEHFCVDKTDTKRELCLLGRSWIKTHNINLIKNGRVLMVPINNGKRYIEVNCIEDGDDAGNGNEVPIYQVQMMRMDDEDITGVDINNAIVDLATYQEDIVSDSSFIQDSAGRKLSGNEGEDDIPSYLKKVIEENKLCFVENNGLGRVSTVKHEIITLDDIPIKSKPYRTTVDEDEALKEQLKDLLELDIISPSDGKWTSPIFFVSKKGTKKLRLVVNYTLLNAKTVKDDYPVPHIEEVLDSLAGAIVFTTLDAASGFWQVEIDENSREKTGFVCKYGTYIFNVVAFGLTNGPSCFQRLMNSLLHKYLGKFVYIFIDDILIYSRNEKEHEEHLKLVFEACMEGNLRLRMAKCQFGKSHVEYLGHDVGARGLQPADSNVKRILELKEPKSCDEVRSLLGTTGYYRRFIEDYAGKAEPLTRLLKKNVPFEWTSKQQDAFNYLISTLMSPPILSFPIREQ
ncbi:hypothetical protein INT48_007457, partial [Thamnidium elegans]